VEISTNIPRPQIFRYCNNWNLKLGFKDLVLSSWSSASQQRDAARSLVFNLRITRQKARAWKKTLKPDKETLAIAKKALDIMD
jgi:hypothetical protein